MLCFRFAMLGLMLILASSLIFVPCPWAAEDATELAKKTQNPVADLISIPFQSNFNFEVGPKNVTQYVGNLQPVIPCQLYVQVGAF